MFLCIRTSLLASVYTTNNRVTRGIDIHHENILHTYFIHASKIHAPRQLFYFGRKHLIPPKIFDNFPKLSEDFSCAIRTFVVMSDDFLRLSAIFERLPLKFRSSSLTGLKLSTESS